MIIRLLPTYIYLFIEAKNALPFHSNVQRWNLLYKIILGRRLQVEGDSTPVLQFSLEKDTNKLI